jgi:hypothetical protein
VTKVKAGQDIVNFGPVSIFKLSHKKKHISILLLFIILGIFLGIFIVIVRYITQIYKKRFTENEKI